MLWGGNMTIALRLIRELGMPALLAALWAGYNALTAPSVWAVKEYVNVFAPAFFFLSWAMSQFFRVQKQVALERNLELLVQRSEQQTLAIAELLRAVSPQNRLDPHAGDAREEIVPLKDVVQFFDRVAHLYNRRNTGKYLATYVEINSLIRAFRPDVRALRICDLGGGTGTLLRWFITDKVSWTNVDISRKSLRLFEEEFDDYPIKEIKCADVRQPGAFEPSTQYEVIVLCFLLSCLDRYPDMAQIRESLAPGGLLVVADNHHTYVEKNPQYGFTEVEGKNLAIFPRPMHADVIRSLFHDPLLDEVAYKVIKLDEDEPYSQVHLFQARRKTRPQ